MRIALALVPRPVPPRLVVRYGSVLAVAAAAIIWWQPGTAVTVLAFAVLGGALAGVFPALISLTPARIGERRAQHVIAWQVGAAAAGGAGISALIGLIIGARGLAVLGPSLTVLAILVVASELVLSRARPRRALTHNDGVRREPQPEPAGPLGLAAEEAVTDKAAAEEGDGEDAVAEEADGVDDGAEEADGEDDGAEEADGDGDDAGGGRR